MGLLYGAMQVANTLVADRYLLPEDAQRQINQLLNDMLATGLLPKRGQFTRGSEPNIAIEHSDTENLLEYLEQ